MFSFGGELKSNKPALCLRVPNSGSKSPAVREWRDQTERLTDRLNASEANLTSPTGHICHGWAVDRRVSPEGLWKHSPDISRREQRSSVQVSRLVFQYIWGINCSIEICARAERREGSRLYWYSWNAPRSRVCAGKRRVIDWRTASRRTSDWFLVSSVKQQRIIKMNSHSFTSPDFSGNSAHIVLNSRLQTTFFDRKFYKYFHTISAQRWFNLKAILKNTLNNKIHSINTF